MTPGWGNTATPKVPQASQRAATGAAEHASATADADRLRSPNPPLTASPFLPATAVVGLAAVRSRTQRGVASEMGWWALAEARRRRGRRRRQSKTREIVVATHTGLAAPSRTTVIASLS